MTRRKCILLFKFIEKRCIINSIGERLKKQIFKAAEMTDKRDKKIIEWNDEEPYREPVDETKPFDVRYPWELRYNKYIENTQLSIYESGWQYCSPGYKYGPARWGYFLLHFIENGRGTLTVNNTSYKLSRNQVFLTLPDTDTTYTADKELPWHYYWVGFNGLNAKEFLIKSGFIENGIYTKSFSCPEKIFSIFKQINDYNSRDETASLGMLGGLYTLFAEMFKENKNIDLPATEKESYIDRAVRYINENYGRPITVKNIAEYVGFDRSYFFKMFKEQIGVFPKEYLINQRMSKARSLMKDAEYSCYEICKMVGYEDYSNFSKTFKKRYGKTPKEYMAQPFEADAQTE